MLTIISVWTVAQEFPAFKTLRYDEDYSDINIDSSSSAYSAVKHLPGRSRNVFLSFGGSARYQFIKVENEDWGERDESSDGYALARHLLHVDLHAGKRVRTFIELQNSLTAGKSDVSPLDKNLLDLHQLFADYEIVNKSSSKIAFRIGRQELLYGSQRMVSVRNGPNNRQSFDGVKVFWTNPLLKLDLFYSHFVLARRGTFDDTSEAALRFWGAYATKQHTPFSMDIFYLGLYKAVAVYDDAIGREARHSIGSRLWKKKGHFNFDIECVYQFGLVHEKPLKAWTASVRSEYNFSGRRKPTVGVKTEMISGDRHYEDNFINTFNPLFPSGGYFGLAALFGPANLIDFHPSVELSLSDKIEWGFDYDIFWRCSLNDGIYTNNMRLIYTGRNNPYRFIGSQLSTLLNYSPSRFLEVKGEFKWFVTGKYLDEAGEGENILFGMLSMLLTF